MKLPFSKLNDGLDDEYLLDEQGYPTDTASEKRSRLEEAEYEEGLEEIIKENQGFLKICPNGL